MHVPYLSLVQFQYFYQPFYIFMTACFLTTCCVLLRFSSTRPFLPFLGHLLVWGGSACFGLSTMCKRIQLTINSGRWLKFENHQMICTVKLQKAIVNVDVILSVGKKGRTENICFINKIKFLLMTYYLLNGMLILCTVLCQAINGEDVVNVTYSVNVNVFITIYRFVVYSKFKIRCIV